MKKWLLALMICLSFASLMSGLFLLPQYINLVETQNQKEETEPEEDLPVHGSSHLKACVYKYVANAQTGTTEIASGGGSITIVHTNASGGTSGDNYSASASATVNGVTTGGGNGDWDTTRGFKVTATPSYGFYVSKIQIGDDTSWYGTSYTSATTKTYSKGMGIWEETTKNIYIDFGRRDVSVTFNPNGGYARINTETEYAGYGNVVKKISSSTTKTIRFGQYFYVQVDSGVSDAFTKTGYTYNYTSVGGTTTYSTISGGGPSQYKRYYQTSYSSSLTVKVYWTANTYALELKVNGGYNVSDQSLRVTYNSSSPPSLTNPTAPSGYTFGGWTTAQNSGSVVINTSKAFVANISGYTNSSKQWVKASDTTLWAKYTANSYTITYAAGGGSFASGVSSTQSYTIVAGKTIYASSSVTRTAYTFSSWKASSVNGNWSNGSTYSAGASLNGMYGSVTLTAQWTANSYTITYAGGGGSLKSGVSSTQSYTTISNSSLYASSNVTRTGYTFSSWKASSVNGNWSNGSTYSAGAGLNTMYGNVTLTAQWTINSYTLTAYANSGSISSTSGWSGTGSSTSKTLNYAAAYSTLPTVSRSNYELKGWYTSSSNGSTVSASTTMGAGNRSIYAQWNAIGWTITLKGRIVGKNGTVTNADNLGGSVLTGSYTSVSSGSTGSGTINQSANTYNYTMHQGSTLTITPTVASGYKYLGYSTDGSTKPSVSSFPTSSSITVPSADTTYYLYFQQVAAPLYYTTERGGYWYYEDGEYPQTFVGSSLSGTSASSTKFNINGTDYTVYTAGGSKYIQVASPMSGTIKLNGQTVTLASGTKYWFRIDPIRWRVSKYGASASAYSLASATSNLVGVSDILGYGRVNTNANPSQSYHATNSSIRLSNVYQSCSAVGFSNITKSDGTTNMTYTFDQLSGDETSSKTTTYTMSLAQEDYLVVASISDIQKAAHNGTAQENLQTYASDLSAMLQCRDYNNSTGWTSSIYNIGSGIAVGPGASCTGKYWANTDNVFGFVYAHQASYATCLGTR